MSALERSVERAKGGRTKTRAGKGKQPASDVAEMTKSELGALARELDIPGRSTMTRADLEKAVTQAGRRKKAS